MRIRLQQWSEPKKPSKGSLLTKKETLPPRRAFFDSSVLPLIMIWVCFSFRVPLMRKCLQFLGWKASSAASITPPPWLRPRRPPHAIRSPSRAPEGPGRGAGPTRSGTGGALSWGAVCVWGSPRRLPRLLSPLRCARGRRNWAEILGSVGNLGFARLFAVAAWWPPQDGAGPRAVPPPGLTGTEVSPPAAAALGHRDVVPSIVLAASCSRQKQPLHHGGQAGRSQAGAGLQKSGPPSPPPPPPP